MEWLFNFLASHQAAITAIATIFIAVSAVVTTILTRKLARENELLRKAGTEPEVIAYLDIGSHFINFVLANVGQGPAQKVRFSIESDDFRFSGALPPEQKIFSEITLNARRSVFFHRVRTSAWCSVLTGFYSPSLNFLPLMS